MKGIKMAAVAAALTLALGGLALAGQRTINLKIDGMSCGMCAPAARKTIEKVNGVKSAQVKGDRAPVVADEKVQDADLVT